MGRPQIDGTMASGPSPVRHVRLPRDLDELLTQRSLAENRKPCDLMREALDNYLCKAS